MAQQFDYSDLYRLLSEFVAEKRTRTIFGKTDDNHALIIGIRNGRIVLFVYAGRRGTAAISAARHIDRIWLRVDEAAAPVSGIELPPTAQIMAALDPTQPAPAVERGGAEREATDRSARSPEAPGSSAVEPPGSPRSDVVMQDARSPAEAQRRGPPAEQGMPRLPGAAEAERIISAIRAASSGLAAKPPSPTAKPDAPAADEPAAPGAASRADAPEPANPASARARSAATDRPPPASAKNGVHVLFETPAKPASDARAVRTGSPAAAASDHKAWSSVFDRAEPQPAAADVFADAQTGFHLWAVGSPAPESTAAGEVHVSAVAEHNHRAWQRFRQQDYPGALAELQAAAALEPDNPVLLANIKRIEEQLRAPGEPEGDPWGKP
jgi:hypothetical protein